MAVLLSFTNIEMFQFPYHAEIWGTVSDWIMILVTGVTAYYLYHTLISQNSVLDLERSKYKEANQPIFSGRFLSYMDNIVQIRIECKSKMAKKVRITYQNRPQLYHFIPRHGEVVYGYYTEMQGNLLENDSFQINIQVDTDRYNDFNFQFFLVFYDMTGINGYYQQIDFRFRATEFRYGDIEPYFHDKTILAFKNFGF